MRKKHWHNIPCMFIAKLNEMKKIAILFSICISLHAFCEAQVRDSVRTRNDKPGTPQSLRKANTAPQNTVPTIDNDAPAQQTIDHGAVEHNDPTNLSAGAKEVPQVINSSGDVPVTPVTIDGGVTPIERPSNDKGVMQNGQGNTSNPIRK